MKILLAVDGSPYTQRMLAYVASHDELLGPGHAYTAVTVVAPIPAHAARFLDRQTLDDYYRDEAEKVLGAVAALAARKGWNVGTVQARGHAADEIAALADSGQYDLVVMGSRGNSTLSNLVLGSVATGVLARCEKPVLLIR